MESEFAFAKSSDGSTSEEIQAFLEESVKDGCEGLMVKMLTSGASTYEPSRRSMNWLKVNSTVFRHSGHTNKDPQYSSRKTTFQVLETLSILLW